MKKMFAEYPIKNLFIHYLNAGKAATALKLKRDFPLRTFWIFYGADLYSILAEKFNYQLHDYSINNSSKQRSLSKIINNIKRSLILGADPDKLVEQFIAQLDHFCFWNEFDYKLLINHFDTKATFKRFVYYELIKRSDSFQKAAIEVADSYVLVNHAASRNGNHKTILSRLYEISHDGRILCPLSYGDDSIRLAIQDFGIQLFGDQFIPLLAFLPRNLYYKELDKVSVALFGHRKQEAAGNIFYLLSKGVKIFLREDNNMMLWLKKRGFHVFSFEKDLNSKADLTGLSPEKARENFELISSEFSVAKEKKDMMLLLDYKAEEESA